MDDGLSAKEKQAFADVFADPALAWHVLETAGLPRSRHPAWVTAELFWSRVSDLLADGVLPEGRTQ